MTENNEGTALRKVGILALGVSLSLAVLGCVLFMSLANTVVQRQAHQEKIAVILRVLRDCLDDVQDMETGQRGYLLTNESAYLEPFNRGRKSFPIHVEELASLVSTHRPEDSDMPRKLASLLRLKEVELGATIELQREGQDFEALQIVKSGKGKQYMRDIRALINEYASGYREQRLDLERKTATALHQAKAAFLFWVAAIAALISTAFWKLRTRQKLLDSVTGISAKKTAQAT